jgi:hypothetical protein
MALCYEWVEGEAFCGIPYVEADDMTPDILEVTCPICLRDLGVLRPCMVRGMSFDKYGEIHETRYDGLTINREQS